MLQLDAIYKAAHVLKEVVRRTDLIYAPQINPESTVYLKPENLQLTGSFKVRGAYYKISQLSDEEKARGVIACSAGNHAQGVALAATKCGIKSLICLPEGAPISKVEATKHYGAEVCLVPGVYDDAYQKALQLRDEKGYTFVHPFDDENVIAGQGTIGLELLEEMPDVEVVIVPIGGGAETSIQLTNALEKLIDSGIQLGERVLGALIIFIIGKFLVNWLNRLFARILEKRKVDPSIQSFLKSMVNILLLIMLILAVIGKLGIELTGFAALLASAGVAIGMALSGNLQNFAGGLIILLFRPYKVGDFIEASTGASGTVKEIQIFHTILITADNKMIYVPNGAMSSGVITNYSKLDTRRIEWNFGVDYGEDYNKVEKVLREIIANDKRILTSPAPFIELGELAASSVNIKIRVWVNSSDYWNVFFSMNQTVYTTFNKEGINFPFPQLTVHQA